MTFLNLLRPAAILHNKYFEIGVGEISQKLGGAPLKQGMKSINNVSKLHNSRIYWFHT